MFRRRLALLALVATVAVTAAPPGRADTVTAPFLRPATLTPGVPHEVGIAVDGLRQACAAWHLSLMSLPLMDADEAPQPGSPAAAFLAVRRLCDTAIHPDQTEWSLFVDDFAGSVAVVLLCLFVGVLISVWSEVIMVIYCKRRGLLTVATILAGLACAPSSWAQNALTSPPVPPDPSPAQVEQAVPELGNALNKPITGAQEDPLVVGTPPPPSLEALQAARAGDQKGDGLETGRADMVRTAALTFGAQGGLAARSFALNELLRRYQPQLDSAYDFHALVLPVSSGQTLMRPPVVSAAQMAFALGDGGQVARETSCIYEITREAQLASTPPNWRIYLVRVWAPPSRPNDGAMPRTKQEAAYWNKWVAEGWGQGEKQAVEIFLSDLGRLERDIVGMARYRVLLRAGLVEQPKVAFQNQAVDGGRDSLHVGDQTIRITDQPGLQGNARRWSPGAGCPQ